MLSKDQIIEELGIAELSASEQEELVAEYYALIGEAIAEGRSEGELNEFQAIIDGNQTVIDAWLSRHRPDYENDPSYQALLDLTTNDNPEGVQPDKMFASAAWVQVNVPNLEELIDRVTEEVKATLW